MKDNMIYKSIAVSSCLMLTMFASLAHAEQTCSDNARDTTPDSRYEVINNDEVKDLKTGLIWQRCVIGRTWVNGECTGTAKELTWHGALIAAKAKADSSKKPYRLPNIRELQGITHYGCEPALNTNYFGTGTEFKDRFFFTVWSSTPSALSGQPFLPAEGAVYIIDQHDGDIQTTVKKRTYYARLVRSE